MGVVRPLPWVGFPNEEAAVLSLVHGLPGPDALLTRCSYVEMGVLLAHPRHSPRPLERMGRGGLRPAGDFVCERLLNELVVAGFLQRRQDGSYERRE